MHLHEDMTYLHFKYRLIGEKRQQASKPVRRESASSMHTRPSAKYDVRVAVLEGAQADCLHIWLDLTCCQPGLLLLSQ